jgi:hypothetical protein
MAQRIFITCRSHHDPIEVGHLACQALLGRGYNATKDYIRWAGSFEDKHTLRKCQVLVDCNVSEASMASEVPLTWYNINAGGLNL